jgi:hypothetical protein
MTRSTKRRDLTYSINEHPALRRRREAAPLNGSCRVYLKGMFGEDFQFTRMASQYALESPDEFCDFRILDARFGLPQFGHCGIENGHVAEFLEDMDAYFTIRGEHPLVISVFCHRSGGQDSSLLKDDAPVFV